MFKKKQKLPTATAEKKRFDGVIQCVTVHLTSSTEGKVDINVKNGNVTTAILSNQIIYADQPVDYTISKDLFDFNNMDLSKVSIKLTAQ